MEFKCQVTFTVPLCALLKCMSRGSWTNEKGFKSGIMGLDPLSCSHIYIDWSTEISVLVINLFLKY